MNSKAVSLLSTLTLVIPTFNRQSYVLRNMRYWSSSEVTVHVMDGSEKAINPEQIERLAPNIHYHHLPGSIWMRFEKANDLVKTQYVSLLADDDFFIPSAAEASILELEKDQELVACCGQRIAKCLKGNLTVHLSTVENHKSSYRKGENSLTQDDPIERMIFHMNPYAPSTIYAVCRRQAWLPTMKLLCAREFSTPVVGELQFELSMSFKGKTKVIDELMWLRSGENRPSGEGYLGFATWYVDPKYSEEVDDFLNITSKGLSAAGSGDYKTIRNGLEQACKTYVASCDNKVRNGRPKKSIPTIMRLLSATTTEAQKAFIKKAINKLPVPLLRALKRRILGSRPYVDIAKGLESKGVHVDWDQLATILTTVRKFHEGKPCPGQAGRTIR